jgi:hypothetical protein
LLNKLNFEYVLFGKFQTDPLEERFGQYRYMSYSFAADSGVRKKGKNKFTLLE